jgi:hypothetical protein
MLIIFFRYHHHMHLAVKLLLGCCCVCFLEVAANISFGKGGCKGAAARNGLESSVWCNHDNTVKKLFIFRPTGGITHGLNTLADAFRVCQKQKRVLFIEKMYRSNSYFSDVFNFEGAAKAYGNVLITEEAADIPTNLRCHGIHIAEWNKYWHKNVNGARYTDDWCAKNASHFVKTRGKWELGRDPCVSHTSRRPAVKKKMNGYYVDWGDGHFTFLSVPPTIKERCHYGAHPPPFRGRALVSNLKLSLQPRIIEIIKGKDAAADTLRLFRGVYVAIHIRDTDLTSEDTKYLYGNFTSGGYEGVKSVYVASDNPKWYSIVEARLRKLSAEGSSFIMPTVVHYTSALDVSAAINGLKKGRVSMKLRKTGLHHVANQTAQNIDTLTDMYYMFMSKWFIPSPKSALSLWVTRLRDNAQEGKAFFLLEE